jgi:putative MATE family efflux protein
MVDSNAGRTARRRGADGPLRRERGAGRDRRGGQRWRSRKEWETRPSADPTDGVSQRTARTATRTARSAIDRELVLLALPALGAAITQPLFLLTDSAIVGHLGTAELAGLSVASAVLLNAVLLCLFLAYGTAATVARRAGSGDLRAALAQGIDGIWLAVAIGVALAIVGLPLAPTLTDLFGTSPSATPHAIVYLGISLIGMPAMLVVLAATGVLRGLKNTRTPLLVLAVSAAVNVVLNLLLVYPAGLGVAGSALGTVIAQTGAAAWLTAVVVRDARRHGAPLSPDLSGIRAAAAAGVSLFARNALLRVTLLSMTFVAAAQGDVALAGHQIAYTLWFLLSTPPLAFGIAGQAMVGHVLGAGDPAGARAIAKRAILWGLTMGLVAATLLVVLRAAYIPLFTTDAAVQDLVLSLALVVAATQPVGAAVYILDGILVAAGDGRYLAWSMLVAVLLFLPLAGVVLATEAGVVVLWWALVGWLLARLVTIVLRYRSDSWVRVGATAG